MKEIPMLYSTPMIQAKLAGTKTQTRRTKGLADINSSGLLDRIEFIGDSRIVDQPRPAIKYDDRLWFWWSAGLGTFDPLYAVRCPWKPGDIIWARESWRKSLAPDGQTSAYYFKADDPTLNAKWKPSIHMPKVAARIWERVTEVRVERLQDISPGDACDEGIEYDNIDAEALEGGELVADFTNYMWRNDPDHESYWFPHFASCVDSYLSLWDSINGEGAHKLNPWVWVIKTEILSITGRPAGLCVYENEVKG